jgi:hypothetical protein
MAWQAYTATANWVFTDDAVRCPRGSGKVVQAGHLVILDNGAAATAALAAGTISSVAPTLTGPQITALAAAQGVANRGSVVAALGLT